MDIRFKWFTAHIQYFMGLSPKKRCYSLLLLVFMGLSRDLKKALLYGGTKTPSRVAAVVIKWEMALKVSANLVECARFQTKKQHQLL